LLNIRCAIGALFRARTASFDQSACDQGACDHMRHAASSPTVGSCSNQTQSPELVVVPRVE
jgi:hypothetical protein